MCPSTTWTARCPPQKALHACHLAACVPPLARAPVTKHQTSPNTSCNPGSHHAPWQVHCAQGALSPLFCFHVLNQVPSSKVPCLLQLAFHELAALYAITDVALVTSLRDGMNLVSYEYVACQSDNAGVLQPLQLSSSGPGMQA